MASRQEEKERRRREREEAERKAQEAQRRKRRLWILGGAAALLVVIVAVAVVVAGGGGSSSAKPPPSLPVAAKQAGCTIKSYPGGYQDRAHTTAPVHYKTNPPSFGPHNPIPAQDGDYVGRTTPAKEHLVHALEHGRIEVQYRPGTPKSTIDALEGLFNQKSDYMLLFQNQTRMPYQVAAVAWTHILGCRRYNPRVLDAIRAFRDAYTLKGPEYVPQPE